MRDLQLCALQPRPLLALELSNQLDFNESVLTPIVLRSRDPVGDITKELREGTDK